MFDEPFKEYDTSEEGDLFKTPSVGFPLNKGLDLDELSEALEKHRTGDWGECTQAEVEANQSALEYEGCVLSIFRTSAGEKFCILTENVGTELSHTSIRLYADFVEIAR